MIIKKVKYKTALIWPAIDLFLMLVVLYALVPKARMLIIFFVYTAVLNNGLIPFPTMTAAIFLGKTHSPFLVAVAGMLGSALSSAVIYYLLTELSNNRHIQRIENSSYISSLKALANKSPFLSLVVFNAVPFPIEPSRFLAIFNRYSVVRYVTAISLGRFVRFYLLAKFGETFRISNEVLVILTGVLIPVPFVARRFSKKANKEAGK
jgi:membrane protein YqaA with SNARE-associated domain